jgi:hypothetical protein
MVIFVTIFPRVSLKMCHTEKKLFTYYVICRSSVRQAILGNDYKIFSELHTKNCNTPIWIKMKFPHKRLILHRPMLRLKHLWCCVIIRQSSISLHHHRKSIKVYFQNTLGTQIVLPDPLLNTHKTCLLKVWRTLKDILDIVYVHIHRWTVLPWFPFVYRGTRDTMMLKRPILLVPSKINNNFNTKRNWNVFTCIIDNPSMLKDEKSKGAFS